MSCEAAESVEDAVLRMARAELLQFFHFFIFFKKTLDFFLESLSHDFISGATMPISTYVFSNASLLMNKMTIRYCRRRI